MTVYPYSQIAPQNLTIHLGVQDQYDKDLALWEQRSRAHLMQGCTPAAQEGETE